MRNLKVKLSMLAVVAGLGTAAATTHKMDSNKKWGRDPMTGEYVDITSQQKGVDYLCNSASVSCTEEYSPDVDPNDQANDSHPGTQNSLNTELGTFIQ